MRNKTVLITGASRGIGRATALAFGENGYNVVVNYAARADAAEKTLQLLSRIPARAMAIAADVADAAQVQDMFARARAAFGPIDVVVNNAGIAQDALFTDITPEAWRQMFAVHVDGAFHCCRCALPEMISRKSGRIINIASIWGMVGASCEVHYSAAKAALIGMTRALAKEVGPSGITVNCVAPGVIDTDMNAGYDEATMRALREETPLGVLGAPEDIARAVLFFASEDARFITGQVLSPNGGIVI
nr:3-oxoacyl-ACP reductase FabG [Maliibacterium massiliense]